MSEALSAKVDPMDVENQIDWLVTRLYSWTDTGKGAASDFRGAARKKADAILDIEPA